MKGVRKKKNVLLYLPPTVSALALPTGARRPVRASLLSPRVAEVFCDPLRRMLRDPQEAKEKQAGLGRYHDPVFNSRFERLYLAYRA